MKRGLRLVLELSINMKRIWQCISILFLILSITGCRIESVKEHDKAIKQQEDQKQDKQETPTVKEEEGAKESKDDASVEPKESKDTAKKESAGNSNASKEQNNTSSKVENTPKQEAPQSSSNPQTPPVVEEPKISYVTISIDVKTLLSNMNQLKENKRPYVPSDGWLLYPVKVEMQEGDTVFSILERITRRNRIALEYQGASSNAFNTVYIQGIGQLYEFDCGNLSGWMYFVNGNYVNVGASAYKVNEGDVITWRYTCDSGKDVSNGAS